MYLLLCQNLFSAIAMMPEPFFTKSDKARTTNKQAKFIYFIFLNHKSKCDMEHTDGGLWHKCCFICRFQKYESDFPWNMPI